jgi:hypothetical protein
MEDESLKPNLLEKGTRWDHYNELRDLFASGVEVLKTLRVKSRSDQERQAKLEHAVEMIEGRLNFITDFTQKTGWGSAIRSAVDGDIDNMYRKMKVERERANATSKENNAANDDEGPEAYTTK